MEPIVEKDVFKITAAASPIEQYALLNARGTGVPTLTTGLIGEGDAMYPKHAALCLETGCLPNAVHYPTSPSTFPWPARTYLLGFR
jgi:hypothetical protein